MRLTETSLLYKKASDLEETNPKGALKLYKRLEALNKPFLNLIFLVAVICPVIAFFTNRGISELVDGKLWVSIVILIALGFMPPLLMWHRRLAKLEAQHSRQPVNYSAIVGRAFFSSTIEFFSKWVVLFVVGFFGTVIAALILMPISMIFDATPFFWQVPGTGIPFYVGASVWWSSLAIYFLAAMTGVFYDVPVGEFLFIRFPQMVKRIPIAFRPMIGEALPIITSLAVGYALYGAATGIVYEYSGLVGNIFAGIMLGVYLSQNLEKDFVFGNLLRIAKARCLVRLGHEDWALYVLRDITEDRWYPPKFSKTPVVIHLTQALRYFTLDLERYRRQKGLPSNRPVFGEVASDRTMEGLSSCWTVDDDEPPVDYPYEEIRDAAEALATAQTKYKEPYVDCIRETKRLVGLSDDQ